MAEPLNRSWVPWSLAALAYVGAYFQRTAPSTILDQLIVDYGVGAAQIGLLTSAYLCGYIILQFPAGVLLDLLGVRRAIVLSLGMTALGTLVFALSHAFWLAVGSRLFVGIGDSLVFSTLIKICGERFSNSHFGRMAALSQAAGYAGGLLATLPLATVVTLWDWRAAFVPISALLFVLMVASFFGIGDSPTPHRHGGRSWLSTFSVVPQTLFRRTTLGSGAAFIGVYVPFVTISGIWGVPMLMQGYGWTRDGASLLIMTAISMQLAGSLAGGYVADWGGVRIRPLMMYLAVVRSAVVLSLAPLFGAHLPAPVLFLSFGIFGLLGGAVQQLQTSSVKAAFTTALIGTAVGIHATLGNTASALLQPGLGVIFDAMWTGRIVDGTRIFPAGAYDLMCLVLAIISLAAALGPLLMLEPRDESQTSPA
jgi:predicted MFS family arabinose efflux permease